MHRDTHFRRLGYSLLLMALAVFLTFELPNPASALAQAPAVGAPELKVRTDSLNYAFAEKLTFTLEADAPAAVVQVVLR